MRFVPSTRRARRVVSVVAVIVVLFVVATVRLFVVPTTNAPEKSGAIFVLGGGGPTTLHEGERLADEGYAPLLVLSLRTNQTCVPDLVPVPSASVRVQCFHANPQTTQGEAEAIERVAKADHLRRIIVVAQTSQVTRARIRVDRCYSGQVLMEGVDSGNVFSWAYAIAYEWASLAKAEVLQRNC